MCIAASLINPAYTHYTLWWNELQHGSPSIQGFPILKSCRRVREKQPDGLLRMSIESTKLLGHISHAQTIHEAKHSTVEPSQHARSKAGTRLASVLSSSVTSRRKSESIFNVPVTAYQFQEPGRRSLTHGKKARAHR